MFACGSWTISYENNDGSGNGFESTGYQAPRSGLYQVDYLVPFGDVTTATSVVPTIDDVKYMGDLNIPP